MHDELGTRLREETSRYASTLRPGDPAGVRRRGDQRRRRRTAFSAALAVTLLAGGTTAYALGPLHNRTGIPLAPGRSQSPASPYPTAASSPPRTAVPTTRMLPAGKAGARSAVPWPLVGPGWSLVTYTTAPGIVPGSAPPPSSAPQTLYLVDPEGGRYAMYTWPSFQRAYFQQSWQLLDWSGDKSRALFESTHPGGHAVLHQLTLATGVMTSFSLSVRGFTPVRYTSPDGTRLLALTTTPSIARAQRFSLSGALETTFAAGPHVTFPVDSPDGTLVATGTGAGIDIVGNAGSPRHAITVPGTDSNVGCSAVRWWNASTVLASCLSSSTSQVRRLWLVTDSGSRPAALTPVQTSSGADLGNTDAWQLPSGLYLQALGACGSEFIARQAGNGSITPIGGAGVNDQVITSVADRLLVFAHRGCLPGGSLLWLNPASGAAQTLIAQPPGEDGVTAVVPYPKAGN